MHEGKHCHGLDIVMWSREDANLILGLAVLGIMKDFSGSLQGSSPLKGLHVLGGARRYLVQEREFGELYWISGMDRLWLGSWGEIK